MEKKEIINELVADHWEIRGLLKELREQSVHQNRKRALVRQLSTWMKWHTLGEQQTIVSFALRHTSTKTAAFSDREEHSVVNNLLEKISRTRSPHQWAARMHFITELVENHLDEEEEEFFPLLRTLISLEENEHMAVRYRKLTLPLEKLRVKVKTPGLLSWIAGRPEPNAAGPLLL